MWQRLGLGHRTGVDVAGEVAGLASDPQARSWQPIDLINRSFGQGVAVTPLQLAVAYAAMVNGGNLITPHVELRAAPADPAEVLDERLSARLRQLLVHAVNSGPRYQRQAQIPGYLVGGKTGTAQIWDARRGAWKEDVFNHTFCGFVGGDEPELVIVVRIHDAAPLIEESWGMSLEVTSSELFRRIAQNAIEVLDIPPAGGSVEP